MKIRKNAHDELVFRHHLNTMVINTFKRLSQHVRAIPSKGIVQFFARDAVPGPTVGNLPPKCGQKSLFEVLSSPFFDMAN